MPGLVVFRRRWSVGSDDLVVPGAFLFTVHLIWTIILGVLLHLVTFDRGKECVLLLWGLVIGYLVILGLSMVADLWICVVAMRGSILDTAPRHSMQYILYGRLVVMFIEAAWLTAGIVWLVKFYVSCPIENAKETVLGMVAWNWCILLSVLVTVWCTYDSAGRSWVKMKQYQRSMRESESKFQYKRSGSTRNWRQRKVLRAYQDSWHQRCRFLFWCASPSDNNRNSFADIARLLSDFFRDLDVVPSDVVAGLVLLRKFQKIERESIVEQKRNDTYEYLSGVPVTARTQFLSLHEGPDLELFQTVIHYAVYAVRAYGWPMYVMTSRLGLCHVCAGLKCCCCMVTATAAEVVDDNCCACNYAALHRLTREGDVELVYATYHVDVGETPFFVALDHDRQKVVISIRGTLSMKDILTDLNAEAEVLPLDPPREDWVGHKGMVQAAQYILDKLREERLIERALQLHPERGTDNYGLVLVGHSLGAGAASILGILLRQEYGDLECYCYAPPGGLLSMPAMEYTKSFTISVIVGKDVVPRIGLNQMEALRADLINAIKRSVDPKWKTIACSILCCGCSEPTSAVELSSTESQVSEYSRAKQHARCRGLHPNDSTIALTSHQPMYPPGRIIHIVRHHPKRGEQALSSREPVYQALWTQNTDYDEVLISPVMIQDHMPDKVLGALNKVITTLGPKKPQRLTSNNGVRNFDEESPKQFQRLYLETSFTSLQSPSGAPSNASSITNGYYSAKSQHSPCPFLNSPVKLQVPLLNQGSNSSSPREEMKPFSTCTNFSSMTRSRPNKSLSLSLKKVGGSFDEKKVDLIHDDWFGLAPLASPESLSELSSISSRTSLTNIEQVKLHQPQLLRTPKIMKRTPKIIGNLSTCADDIRNIRNFQLSKVFLRSSVNNSSNSSSNLSYESASSTKYSGESAMSLTKPGSRNENLGTKEDINVITIVNDNNNTTSDSDDFQSAEDILDNVMASAGCKDYFNTASTFLETHFDLLEDPKTYQSSPSSSSPQDIDPDIVSNFAIDLNLDKEHRSMQFRHREDCDSKATSSVDSGSVCRTPSDVKNVTFNPQVVAIDRKTPQGSPNKSSWLMLPHFKSKSNKHKIDVSRGEIPRVSIGEAPKTILLKKREGDECFSRTEALPLLSGLNAGNNGSEKTSPSFVRRKKYVYPTDVAIVTKEESIV